VTLLVTKNAIFVLGPHSHHPVDEAYLYFKLQEKCKMQNTSHAVMSQRTEPADSYDDFPTPPWATRALIEHVIGNHWQNATCLEPGCGAGYMSRTLREYFGTVDAYDVLDFGQNEVRDFLTYTYQKGQYNWIITNPPFKYAEAFLSKGLTIATVGVCIFARTVFVESIGRYNRIFKEHPPSIMAFFSERVPINKGIVAETNTTATSYSWFVWMKAVSPRPPVWIPPCRSVLERPEDYTVPPGYRRRAVL
jgi:hypothetical protein